MRSSFSIGVCVCSLALFFGCGDAADGGGAGNAPGGGAGNAPGGDKNECGRVGGDEAAALCNRWCEADECGHPINQADNQPFYICMYNCLSLLGGCCGDGDAFQMTCELDAGCPEDRCPNRSGVELCDLSLQEEAPLVKLCFACLDEDNQCRRENGVDIPCQNAYNACLGTHSCDWTPVEGTCLTYEFAGHCTFDECMEDYRTLGALERCYAVKPPDGP